MRLPATAATSAAASTDAVADRIQECDPNEQKKGDDERHEDDEPCRTEGVFEWFDPQDVIDVESDCVRQHGVEVGVENVGSVVCHFVITAWYFFKRLSIVKQKRKKCNLYNNNEVISTF